MSTPLGVKYSLLNSISPQEFEKIASAKSGELLLTHFEIETELVHNPDNYPDLFCSAENLITYAANKIFSSVESSKEIRNAIYGYMEKDPTVYARIIMKKYREALKNENKFWEELLQFCPLTSQHFDVEFLEALAFKNVGIAQSVSCILPQIIEKKEGELSIFMLNSEVLLSLEHLRQRILGIYPENLFINYYLFDTQKESINFRLFLKRSHFDYLIFVLQDVRWKRQLLKTKNILSLTDTNIDRLSAFLIEAYKAIENGLKNAIEKKLWWQTEEIVKAGFLENVFSQENISHSWALILIKLKYIDYMIQRKRDDEFFLSEAYQYVVMEIAKKNIIFDWHLNHKDKTFFQFMMAKISDPTGKEKIINDLIMEEGFLFSELVYQSSSRDIAAFINVLLANDIQDRQLLSLIRASTHLQNYILTSIITIIEQNKNFREPQIRLLKTAIKNISDVDILSFSNTTLLAIIDDEKIRMFLESALKRVLSLEKTTDINALIAKLNNLESQFQKFISLDIRQTLFLACESGDMVFIFSDFFSDLFSDNEENVLLDRLKVENKIISFYNETLLRYSQQYPGAFKKAAISQFSSIEDGNKLLFILTEIPGIEFNFSISIDIWDRIFSHNINLNEKSLVCQMEKYIIRINQESGNSFLDVNFKLLCLKNSVYRMHFLRSLSENQILRIEDDISDLIAVDLVNMNCEILWELYDKGEHAKTTTEFSLNKLLSSSTDSKLFPDLISAMVRNLYHNEKKVRGSFNEEIGKLEFLRNISPLHYFGAFSSPEIKLQDDGEKLFLQNLFLSEVCQKEFIENHAQIFYIIFSEMNMPFILAYATDIYHKFFIQNILLSKASEIFSIHRRLFWILFDVIPKESHLTFINNNLILKESFLSSFVDETAPHTTIYRLNLLLESNIRNNDKLSLILKIDLKILLLFIQDINFNISLIDKHPDFFITLITALKQEQKCECFTASDWNKLLTSSNQDLVGYILADSEFCLHASAIINASDEKLNKVFLNALSDSQHKFFSDKHKSQLRYENVIKGQLRLLLDAYHSSIELTTASSKYTGGNLEVLVKIISHQNVREILMRNIFESEISSEELLPAFFDFFNKLHIDYQNLENIFIAEIFKYGKHLNHDKKIKFQKILLEFVRHNKEFIKIVLSKHEYSAVVFFDNNKELLSDLLVRYMNDSEIIKLILDNKKTEPSPLYSPKFFGAQTKESVKRFSLLMLSPNKLRLFCKNSPVILECILDSKDLFSFAFVENSILNKNMGEYLFQLLSSAHTDIVDLILNNAKDMEKKCFNFSALSSEQSAALSKHSRWSEIQQLMKLHSPSHQLTTLVSAGIAGSQQLVEKVTTQSATVTATGIQNLTQLTDKLSAPIVLKETELRNFGHSLFSSSPPKFDSKPASPSEILDFPGDPNLVAKHGKKRSDKKSENNSPRPG